MWFWDRFSSKFLMLFIVKTPFLASVLGKGKVLTAKSINFTMKIDPKITGKLCRKFLVFYFMLQMYFLMLVSSGSVWERFWRPTDSKNHQNMHSISHIALQ